MGNAHGLPDVEGFSREEVSRSEFENHDTLVHFFSAELSRPRKYDFFYSLINHLSLSNYRLEKRFHKLDLDRSGAISVKEFLSVPELRDNPLVQRVADVLDSNRSGEVDFKGKKYTEVMLLHKLQGFVG